MSRRIRKIVILGGGTAGWMTASYLSKALEGTVEITVLEAPTIPKIGVGEATVPDLQHVFFDYLGIPEDEWMRECDASFKMAVKFVNWRTPGCFLEPLESSGLYFTYAAIYQLVKYFPDRSFDDVLSKRFNREIAEMYDDTRDFIPAHFYFSPREDTPCWRANKAITLAPEIQEKVNMYRAGLPVNPPVFGEDAYYTNFEAEFLNFWTNGSYYCIFAGLGMLPEHETPLLAYKPASRGVANGLFAHASPERRTQADPERQAQADSERRTQASVPRPDDCAYVIYTSGTTGRPKGVEVTYGGLTRFLDALATLDLPPGGTGINAVSPAFDGWLWCALLSLTHGQGMTIIDLHAEDDDRVDLGERIAAITPRTVCLTPSLPAGHVDALGGAELVVVAGEPCPPRLAERLLADHRVLNVYGPTEATIAATWADSARGDDVSTIGRPLPGYLAHVLDERGRRVEPGGVGELYIGGPAVARGYRGRADLTAERFVPDPFTGGDARMYRTGDLVVLRADRRMEYLGRADDQVKVRGFRVELAEIERVAVRHAGVRSAVAFVLESGEAIGVAIVADGRSAPAATASSLREHLREHLPESFAPGVVNVVDTLPTTPSGKADRAALARASSAANTSADRRPRTAHEIQVSAIWSLLLDRRVDDVRADFFELGGHSLLAARVVATIRRATGIRLSMRHLLGSPTVAGLAGELDRLRDQADATVTP